MIDGESWLHFLGSVYLLAAAGEYGKLAERDVARNKYDGFLVWVVTRAAYLVMAVLWPITELIGLGVRIAKNGD